MKSVLIDFFALLYSASFVLVPIGYLMLVARWLDREAAAIRSLTEKRGDHPLDKTDENRMYRRCGGLAAIGLLLLLAAETFVFLNAHGIIRAASKMNSFFD